MFDVSGLIFRCIWADFVSVYLGLFCFGVSGLILFRCIWVNFFRLIWVMEYSALLSGMLCCSHWNALPFSAECSALPNGIIIIIIMYIYHALINALSAHMIHINLNMIFYTHVEHSPTKTIYISIIKNKI